MKNNIMVKNNWDDDRLQVVMIIYGNYPNNGRNRNGEIDYISSLKDKEQFFHSQYYVKHAETNYNDNQIYQEAIQKASKTYNHLDLIVKNTNILGNIIFDHIYHEEINKKDGLLSIPPFEPTEEQYEALEKLLSQLSKVGYDEIGIQGRFYQVSLGTVDADIDLTIDSKDILSIPNIIREIYNPRRKRGR